MTTTWLEKDQLIPAVKKQLIQADIVLDVGCGILPQKLIKPQVHICCEPFKQYIESLQEKNKNRYNPYYIYINASWNDVIKLFPPKSIDTIFLLDVIEHLSKEKASFILKETEKIAKSQIVIYTPLGFLPQEHPDGKDCWGLDGGMWQKHKSGWFPEDFDNSWNIFAVKTYHIKDNLGRRFEKPYGAFYAIKNLQTNPVFSPIRENVNRLIDKIINVLRRIRRVH